MPVFVTGAAGFIGRHVCRALLQRGEEVVGVDNLNSFYARLCTFFFSGPGPEDGLVGDELERVAEGHDDTAHVVDVLPFAAV